MGLDFSKKVPELPEPKRNGESKYSGIIKAIRTQGRRLT